MIPFTILIGVYITQFLISSDLKTEQELLKQWKNRQSKEKSERERLLGKYKSSKIPRVVTSHRPVEMNVGKQIVAGSAKYEPPKPR